jgi:hypothetical protein
VVVELLHYQHVPHRAHQDEILLAAGRVLAERGPAGVLEGCRQQAIGPIAALVRPEIVDLLEIDPVHRREWHELGDVDGIGGFLVERLDLLGREPYVLALGG